MIAALQTEENILQTRPPRQERRALKDKSHQQFAIHFLRRACHR